MTLPENTQIPNDFTVPNAVMQFDVWVDNPEEDPLPDMSPYYIHHVLVDVQGTEIASFWTLNGKVLSKAEEPVYVPYDSPHHPSAPMVVYGYHAVNNERVLRAYIEYELKVDTNAQGESMWIVVANVGNRSREWNLSVKDEAVVASHLKDWII